MKLPFHLLRRMITLTRRLLHVRLCCCQSETGDVGQILTFHRRRRAESAPSVLWCSRSVKLKGTLEKKQWNIAGNCRTHWKIPTNQKWLGVFIFETLESQQHQTRGTIQQRHSTVGNKASAFSSSPHLQLRHSGPLTTPPPVTWSSTDKMPSVGLKCSGLFTSSCHRDSTLYSVLERHLSIKCYYHIYYLPSVQASCKEHRGT